MRDRQRVPLIDTAAAYFHEWQVGEGIMGSRMDRSEIFVTTKLGISDDGYERALRASDVSQRRLGLDYVDRDLLHWPVPSDLDAAAVVFPIARESGSAKSGCSDNRASVSRMPITRIMKETSR